MYFQVFLVFLDTQKVGKWMNGFLFLCVRIFRELMNTAWNFGVGGAFTTQSKSRTLGLWTLLFSLWRNRRGCKSRQRNRESPREFPHHAVAATLLYAVGSGGTEPAPEDFSEQLQTGVHGHGSDHQPSQGESSRTSGAPVSTGHIQFRNIDMFNLQIYFKKNNTNVSLVSAPAPPWRHCVS